MDSTEDKEWATEEDASTEVLEESVSSLTAPESDEEEGSDEHARAAAPCQPSPEDTIISAPASEDSEFPESQGVDTEEDEKGYEAAGEDEQETFELDEEETIQQKDEGEIDSQEVTESGSEADWESDVEREAARVMEGLEQTKRALEPTEKDQFEEDRGQEDVLVTQRDEEVENYQNTVKELTAAVIEREGKIGAHQLE